MQFRQGGGRGRRSGARGLSDTAEAQPQQAPLPRRGLSLPGAQALKSSSTGTGRSAAAAGAAPPPGLFPPRRADLKARSNRYRPERGLPPPGSFPPRRADFKEQFNRYRPERGLPPPAPAKHGPSARPASLIFWAKPGH